MVKRSLRGRLKTVKAGYGVLAGVWLGFDCTAFVHLNPPNFPRSFLSSWVNVIVCLVSPRASNRLREPAMIPCEVLSNGFWSLERFPAMARDSWLMPGVDVSLLR